ncbi:glycosyl hydrolase family 28-related protein [Pendulispora albinea]|uniref:Rhamnogalacturonase A/B/Epimerase-like pectate lyase domain-containing protein n=1 Tax=Pendulispora albinea TaxID=2741071 RepID=A0ABZ2MA92_9BACT
MRFRQWRAAFLRVPGVVFFAQACGCGSGEPPAAEIDQRADPTGSSWIRKGESVDPHLAASPAALPSCNQVAPKDGIGGVFNVADFGAKPDGSDAYPGIQAAINAACAASVGTGLPPAAVYLPPGQYTTDRPLVITCEAGFEMFGACRAGVEIVPRFAGPALAVNPVGEKLPTGPALFGSGNSAVTDENAWHLELRDMPAVELDGKAQFTAEAFIRLSATAAGFRSIVSSYGVTSGTAANAPVLPEGEAFALGVQGNDDRTPPTLKGVIKVGDRLIAIGGAPNVGNDCASDAQPGQVSLGVPHHVAIAYDGAMVRLFLDGKKTYCASATGTLRQEADETVSVGPFLGGLDSRYYFPPIVGNIDSVRLSDTARYTNTFTRPEAKHTDDGAHTLALINFEPLPAPPPAPPGQPALQNPTSIIPAHSQGKTFWLPIRSKNTTRYGFIQGIRLHDFTIAGGMGLFGYNMATSQLWKMTCRGCDYGFAALGNSWGSYANDLEATAAPDRGRYGVIAYSTHGSEFHGIKASGQTLPFVINGGAQTVISNVTITPDRAKTVYGMYLLEDSPVINGVSIPASGTSPVWRGAIAAASSWAPFQLQRGQIGNMQNPHVPTAPVVVRRAPIHTKPDAVTAGAVIQGTSFTGTGSASEIVRVLTAPGAQNVKPLVILGATKDSNVPWSNESVTTCTAPGTLCSELAAAPDPNAIAPMASGSDVVRGVTTTRVFDITAAPYGAKGDGATDAYTAIQSAIDAACVAQNGGTPSTVFFPNAAKSYLVKKPLLVHCNGLRLEGAQRDRSMIDVSFGPTGFDGAGPALVLEPPGMTGVDLVPSLFGTGQAMKTNGSSYWLDLRDNHPSAELDGLTQFTAEAVIKLTAASSGYGGIVQSHGCFGSGGVLPGCTSAFSIGVNGQSLVASMNLGGKTYSLQGPAIALNTTYHVALTRDGAAIRLFAKPVTSSPVTRADTAGPAPADTAGPAPAGTAGAGPTDPCAGDPIPIPGMVACVAASGAIAQGLHEDVSVGPRTTGFDGAVRDPAMIGVIDSVRLSNKDRYPTTTYAPPGAKLGRDASTLALVDFVTQVSNGTNTAFATQGYNATVGNVWYPVRRTAEPNGTAEGKLSNITVHDMTIRNRSGLFAMNAVGSRFASFQISSATFGMQLDGDSSDSTFDEVRLLNEARLGLVVVNGNRNVYNNFGGGVGPLPLVVVGGSGQQFQNVFIDSRGTIYGSIFLNVGATVEGLYTDNEGISSDWRSSLVVVNPTTPFKLFKGEIDQAWQTVEQSQGLKPPSIPIIVDGGQGIRLVGTSFSAGTSYWNECIDPPACTTKDWSRSPNLPAGHIYFNTPPQQQSAAVNVTTNDARVPIANDPSKILSLGN